MTRLGRWQSSDSHRAHRGDADDGDGDARDGVRGVGRNRRVALPQVPLSSHTSVSSSSCGNSSAHTPPCSRTCLQYSPWPSYSHKCSRRTVSVFGKALARVPAPDILHDDRSNSSVSMSANKDADEWDKQAASEGIHKATPVSDASSAPTDTAYVNGPHKSSAIPGIRASDTVAPALDNASVALDNASTSVPGIASGLDRTLPVWGSAQAPVQAWNNARALGSVQA